MSRALQVVPFVIPSGTAVSNVQNLESFIIKGIAMPAAWDAAALTFLSSPDDPALVQSDRPGTGAPFPLQSARDSTGAEISFAVVAGQYFIVAAGNALDGLGFTQLRSGTNTTPVNQTAQRIIRVLAQVRT